MKMPFYYKLTTGSCLALVLAIAGCQSPTTTNSVMRSNQNNSQSSNLPTHENSQASQQSLSQQALHIQRALANKDYTSIVNDIHPIRGVRFSMYAYIRPQSDKIFSRDQFARYLEESKIRFTWGDLDGTGDLLIMPLHTYLETWVDGSKYNDARVTVNTFESRGNMINNVNDIYPKLDVVDFYYKGSNKYDGMDWRGMRMVFDNYQGQRYLVAIINDQWTV